MKKITDNQLIELGFEFHYDTWILDYDYEFNQKTNELFSINDGYGDVEFIVKIDDFNHLKTIVETFII